MIIERFEVTPDHIKLLQAMYVGWNVSENGAPTIDPKRPYGNSCVTEDIAKILGWKMPDEDGEFTLPEDKDDPFEKVYNQAMKIHKETETCLQILLVNLSIGPGTYEKEGYGRNWKKL